MTKNASLLALLLFCFVGIEIQAALPIERAKRYKKRRVRNQNQNLGRVGLKVGLLYDFLQQNSTSLHGLGAAAFLSYSMDFPYNPISIELEGGYGLHFMNQASFKLHTVPFRVSSFYRMRTGKKSLWKLGILSLLEIRVSKEVAKNSDFSVAPGWGLISQWEWSSFIFELSAHIRKIRNQENYLSSSLRLGYRF